MRVGVRVYCSECGLMKKPRGRSQPLGMALCDHNCEGYDKEPYVGDLWPLETEEDFGYPIGPHGWVERPAKATAQEGTDNA